MWPRVIRKAARLVALVRPQQGRARQTPASQESPQSRESSQQSLALWPTDEAVPVASPEAAELWIAVHLPHLPFEAAECRGTSQLVAMVELHSRSQHVVDVSEAAWNEGVRPGMTMASAMVLAPTLQAVPRDARRERELLERIAARAQAFTPRVSLVPPDGLLLEVKGSLHLFDGARGLHRILEDEYRALGVSAVLALAPTPLAALASARAGRPCMVTDPTQLVGHVASLPLGTLRWQGDVLARLARIGVRTIGQALRLPRVGFARRFGVAQLATLDRLTGRQADLRDPFRTPERFRKRFDFSYELVYHASILEALGPVLEEMGRFLLARQCGVMQIDCLLKHRQSPPTRCTLRLAAPAADAKRIGELLGERLASIALPEPVRSCELRSGPLLARSLSSSSLWQAGEQGGGTDPRAPEFIERLRARLGPQAVYGLQLSGGHRPETAWRTAEPVVVAERTSPLHAEMPCPPFRRPLWLLPKPEPLETCGGLPLRGGSLRLISEPERIETGWWDSVGIKRDYYTAVDSSGVKLWVYRERSSPHGWFLQGLFG